MIATTGSKLIRATARPTDIPFDKTLFARVEADLAANAGWLRPNERWELESLFPDEARQAEPSFGDMLAPWLGGAGARSATAEQVQAYADYLAPHDALGLMKFYQESFERGEAADLTLADLGTLQDVLLIAKFGGGSAGKLRVLEIGGGYGRLAEAVFHQMKGAADVRYVLVDAVPASLVYAYVYLRQARPDLRVGFYLDGPYDPESHDCYIVADWHAERLLGDHVFDVGCNIASIQEMEDETVAWCMRLFDSRIREEGLIYLQNSRDFIYVRDLPTPPNWQLVLKEQTPRSWTPHYPLEVFFRTSEDQSVGNAQVDVAYLRGVALRLGAGLRDATEAARKASDEHGHVRTKLLNSLKAMTENRDMFREDMHREIERRRAVEAKLAEGKVSEQPTLLVPPHQ